MIWLALVLLGAVDAAGVPAAQGVEIVLGTTRGELGSEVTIQAVVRSPGRPLNAIYNDIDFQRETSVAQASGRPACQSGENVSFIFRPAGCVATDSCSKVRTAANLVRPEIDEAVLYTCTVRIAPDALPGLYPLACSYSAAYSFPLNEPLATTCTNGNVVVRSCTGDCNEDGVVHIDELVRGVGIVLGDLDASTCRAVDRDGDAAPDISDLIEAVDRAVNGCLEDR